MTSTAPTQVPTWSDPRPVQALHRRRAEDGADQQRCVQPLPAAAPQREGHRRGDGFAAVHRHQRSREPPARAEGDHGRGCRALSQTRGRADRWSAAPAAAHPTFPPTSGRLYQSGSVEQQRQRAKRTAAWVGAIAVMVYVGFILSGVIGR
ncbi:hypothetical protein G6F59_014809 [Rhizopus arrhizus]|nr:hypothetical protein G6F59_014809 [Rhizopus arrhizus]